ncbi:MAG: ArnT family glycosyltransferase, partial [Vicinamibacterales bacterium]
RYGAALAVIALLAAYFYGTKLDQAPPFLHHDEIFVGLLGHSIAESGRDLSGRFIPVYFQIPSTVNWYPPIVVYATAAWLSVLPLSDFAVRLPNVCVGVLSVVLMYFVARRVSHNDRLGLLAAALLAVTPAHFIQSRISTDSLYPVVFILLWLLSLFRFLDRPSSWRIFLATGVLGIGVFSYIASVVMMPLYLAMTLALLLWDRRPMRHVVFAAAGFAWPMLLAAAFLAQHPEILGDFSTKYSLSGGQADLNPLQRLREAFTSWNISDRLNLFHSFFDPGYLFVTGGTNIAHSTRQVGVFLAPLAAFIAVGAYEAITRPNRAALLALAGFVTAPTAAVIVSESYAIPRELPVLPFGVLLATMGVAVMWRAPLSRSPKPIAVTLAVVLLILGSGYAARMLIGQGRFSGSAVVLIVIGAALWVVGRECERRRSWRPVAAGLLLLIPVQF